jgi:hypothetical protein
MRHQSLYPFTALTMLVFITSCGGGDTNGGDNPYPNAIIPEKLTFNVTVQQNTEAVKADVMTELESYDPESGTYVFTNEADQVADLAPGKVVLFEGHSLRKISGVEKREGKIIVHSEFAKLTDYYKDADITYSQKITWDNQAAASTRVQLGEPKVIMAGFGQLAQAESDGGEGATESDFEGSEEGLHVRLQQEINGWKVGFELTPQSGDRLNIKLTAEREHVCTISAEGHISSFTSNADIQISGGETQEFSYNNDGMEGEVEVKFAAVGLGSDVAILEIPASIERTILVNGIIPVTLRLKANLQIIPEVSVGSSSQASVILRYNSNTGFAYNAGSVTAQGEVTSDGPEQTGDCNTASAAVAGMGVSVEFPRFEIGILGNLVVPYLLIKTHTSSFIQTGAFGGRPCHQATCKYEAHAGVNMSFLNVASINYDYKITEHEQRWTAPGSQCDD